MAPETSDLSSLTEQDRFLTEEEDRAIMENIAQTKFGMSLEEFTKAWMAGRVRRRSGQARGCRRSGNDAARILDQMTISRNPAEAVGQYRHAVQRLLSCVTESAVDVAGGYYTSPFHTHFPCTMVRLVQMASPPHPGYQSR